MPSNPAPDGTRGLDRVYQRFADDFRGQYYNTWGHNAPRSCTDEDIVKMHEAARQNKFNYSDRMRKDEVLLHMLYWVNPDVAGR